MPRRPADWCNHGNHVGPCGFKYTETIRDDVGFFHPPSGITRTMLVGVCDCVGDHE